MLSSQLRSWSSANSATDLSIELLESASLQKRGEAPEQSAYLEHELGACE